MMSLATDARSCLRGVVCPPVSTLFLPYLTRLTRPQYAPLSRDAYSTRSWSISPSPSKVLLQKARDPLLEPARECVTLDYVYEIKGGRRCWRRSGSICQRSDRPEISARGR